MPDNQQDARSEGAEIRCERCGAVVRWHKGRLLDACDFKPEVCPQSGEQAHILSPEHERWCVPGFADPKWVLFYSDTERGLDMFDTESEARAAFERATLNWNCRLLAPVPRSPEHEDVRTESAETARCVHESNLEIIEGECNMAIECGQALDQHWANDTMLAVVTDYRAAIRERDEAREERDEYIELYGRGNEINFEVSRRGSKAVDRAKAAKAKVAGLTETLRASNVDRMALCEQVAALESDLKAMAFDPARVIRVEGKVV